MHQVQSPFIRRHRRAVLLVVATRWNRLIESIRDSYRPELHYMRGPGPRWRAKHQNHAEYPAA